MNNEKRRELNEDWKGLDAFHSEEVERERESILWYKNEVDNGGDNGVGWKYRSDEDVNWEEND
jgi:hypothetical protein